jgi:hypothetical protein
VRDLKEKFKMLEEVNTGNRVFEKGVEYPVSDLPAHTLQGWKQIGWCEDAPKGVEIDDISRRLDKKDNDTSKRTSKTGRRKQTPGLDKS